MVWVNKVKDLGTTYKSFQKEKSIKVRKLFLQQIFWIFTYGFIFVGG